MVINIGKLVKAVKPSSYYTTSKHCKNVTRKHICHCQPLLKHPVKAYSCTRKDHALLASIRLGRQWQI